MSEKVFSIQGQGLHLNTADDIKPHLQRLRAISGTVEEIHFGGNTIGVEASLALAKVLKELTVLKVADFADIFTGRLISEIPQSLSAICDALKDSPTLIELNLSDNAFGGRSAEPMVPFLTHNRTFQVLKLNNNGLGVSGGTTVAKALLESARLSHSEGKPSNLRVVVCGRNRLENGSAPVWAEAFAAHGGLVEVRLPQNGIRPEGIEKLAAGLSKNPYLEYLDLQDNTATSTGSRAIAKALSSWPRLRTLNLSDLLLGAHGGIALSLALGQGANTSLVALKLQYGELDRRALDILAKSIHDHLPMLTTLELNGNKADPEDECIENIKAALEWHGHGDALDELDDMEDVDEEEEEEEGEGEGEEEEEEEEGEGEEEEEEEEGEGEEGAKEINDTKKPGDQDTDTLANLMGKVTLNSGNGFVVA